MKTAAQVFKKKFKNKIFLTADDIAEFLGVTRRTAYNKIHEIMGQREHDRGCWRVPVERFTDWGRKKGLFPRDM